MRSVYRFTLFALLGLLAFVSSPTLSAQFPFGSKLVIDTVSIYSSLPGPDGSRRLSISFRLYNSSGSGVVVASPWNAQVVFGTDSATYSVPALGPNASAYVSRTIETTAAQVPISINVIAAQPVNQDRSARATRPIGRSPIQSRAVTAQYTAQPAGDFGRWESIGPSKISSTPFESGRVATIAVDPRSPYIVYAGARGSGLWKSSNSSMVWFPMTDSLPTQQISAVAIDPNNPDRVVIATPTGVFQSFNGGSVWTLLNANDLQGSGSDGGALLIAKSVNPTMYLSTASGVQISTNSGIAWASVLGQGITPQADQLRASSLQISTSDPTHLFAALGTPDPNVAGQAPGVFEASDNGLVGADWHRLQGCPSAPLPTLPSATNVWIAESQGTMFVSYRTGTDQVGLWRSNPATCTVNNWTEHTWQNITPPTPCGDPVNNWGYLYASPFNSFYLYKGGVSLCRSNLAGTLPELVPGSQIHSDHHVAVVAPSNPAIVYFGSDGGIYRSLDNGTTLSFVGEGMSNTEFFKVDNDGSSFVTAGVSQDNALEAWDGSTSPIWTELGGGDGSLVAFDRANPAGVYWVDQSMKEFTRTQPGQPGQAIGKNAPFPDCLSYNEFPAGVYEGLVSTGGTPALGITARGIWSGPPWQQVLASTGTPVSPSAPCDSSNGMPGDFTRINMIHDGSGIWVAANNIGHVFYGIYNQPPPVDVFHSTPAAAPSAIAFASPGTFYVSMNAGTQGYIYRLQCLTGCTSESAWPATMPGEVTAISVDPLTPDTLLAAVRGQGIYRGVRSASGTWTWSVFNNGLPAGVTVTDLQPRRDGTIVAATYGRGAYTLLTRSNVPPQQLSARGHVVDFTAQRHLPTKPTGPGNPETITVTLDSKPGFTFTGTSTSTSYDIIIRTAESNNTFVTITYVSTSATSGRIVSIIGTTTKLPPR